MDEWTNGRVRRRYQCCAECLDKEESRITIVWRLEARRRRFFPSLPTRALRAAAGAPSCAASASELLGTTLPAAVAGAETVRKAGSTEL